MPTKTEHKNMKAFHPLWVQSKSKDIFPMIYGAFKFKVNRLYYQLTPDLLSDNNSSCLGPVPICIIVIISNFKK